MMSQMFCDKLITNENSFTCPICNCILYSQKCYQGHRYICKGKGYFGYKCLECNKFTYCQNNTTSDVKESHICNEGFVCKFCFLKKEFNHQCPIKIEKNVRFLTRLGFFKIVSDINQKPIMVIFYREEEQRGLFSKYIFFDEELNDTAFEAEGVFKKAYIDAKWDLNIEFNNQDKSSKRYKASSLQRPIPQTSSSTMQTLGHQVLHFLLNKDFCNTTYICEDSSSSNMVYPS